MCKQGFCRPNEAAKLRRAMVGCGMDGITTVAGPSVEEQSSPVVVVGQAGYLLTSGSLMRALRAASPLARFCHQADHGSSDSALACHYHFLHD
jgi:hypothetical protein